MHPAEIKAIRDQLGMTQEQVARAIGLEGGSAKDTFRQWENGRRPISGTSWGGCFSCPAQAQSGSVSSNASSFFIGEFPLQLGDGSQLRIGPALPGDRSGMFVSQALHPLAVALGDRRLHQRRVMLVRLALVKDRAPDKRGNGSGRNPGPAGQALEEAQHLRRADQIGDQPDGTAQADGGE
jgi:DNA-binding XRE family transcriptional regulator